MQTAPNNVLPPLPEPVNPPQSEFPAASTAFPAPKIGLVPPQLPQDKKDDKPPVTEEQKQDRNLVGLLIGILAVSVVVIVGLLFLLSRIS